MSSRHLSCGCRRGFYYCPEAVALWQAVDAAYQAACRSETKEAWQTYDQVRARYDRHFRESELRNEPL